MLRYLQAWAARDSVWVQADYMEGEAEVFSEELTVENLRSFVTLHTLPHITPFSMEHEAWKTIFRDPRMKHLILFTNQESGKENLEEVKIVAKEAKKEIMTVSVLVDDAMNQKILDIFQVKPEDAPTFRAAITSKKGIMKFKPESSDIDSGNIR